MLPTRVCHRLVHRVLPVRYGAICRISSLISPTSYDVEIIGSSNDSLIIIAQTIMAKRRQLRTIDGGDPGRSVGHRADRFCGRESTNRRWIWCFQRFYRSIDMLGACFVAVRYGAEWGAERLVGSEAILNIFLAISQSRWKATESRLKREPKLRFAACPTFMFGF